MPALDSLVGEVSVVSRVGVMPVLIDLEVNRLLASMIKGKSFWEAVLPDWANHDITNHTLKSLVESGLEYTRGDYRKLAEFFRISKEDYSKFSQFLKMHDLTPSREYVTSLRTQDPAIH